VLNYIRNWIVQIIFVYPNYCVWVSENMLLNYWFVQTFFVISITAVLIDSVFESVLCSKNELITNVGIIAVNV